MVDILPLSLSACNPNLENGPQNCTDQNGKSIYLRTDPFYLRSLPCKFTKTCISIYKIKKEVEESKRKVSHHVTTQ